MKLIITFLASMFLMAGWLILLIQSPRMAALDWYAVAWIFGLAVLTTIPVMMAASLYNEGRKDAAKAIREKYTLIEKG